MARRHRGTPRSEEREEGRSLQHAIHNDLRFQHGQQRHVAERHTGVLANGCAQPPDYQLLARHRHPAIQQMLDNRHVIEHDESNQTPLGLAEPQPVESVGRVASEMRGVVSGWGTPRSRYRRRGGMMGTGRERWHDDIGYEVRAGGRAGRPRQQGGKGAEGGWMRTWE